MNSYHEITKVLVNRVRAHCAAQITPINMREAVNVGAELDTCAAGLVRAFIQMWITKGESTVETREYKWTATYFVPKTWHDHLLRDIRDRGMLPWLPRWIRNKITVNFEVLTKIEVVQTPVTIVNVCPHADIPWDKGADQHIVFLYPNRSDTLSFQ